MPAHTATTACLKRGFFVKVTLFIINQIGAKIEEYGWKRQQVLLEQRSNQLKPFLSWKIMAEGYAIL